MNRFERRKFTYQIRKWGLGLLANLWLVITVCPVSFGYTLTVTKLTDQGYDALVPDLIAYCGPWSAHKSNPFLNDFATLTLKFDAGEIGQDFSAGITLGQREAAKLGATNVYYVSGVKRKGSREIASLTFHLMRSDEAAKRVDLNLTKDEQDQQWKFFQEYANDIDQTDFGKQSKKYRSSEEYITLVGTDKAPDAEAHFFEENIELYKKDRWHLKEIGDEYIKKGMKDRNLLPWPSVNEDGSLDLETWKKEAYETDDAMKKWIYPVQLCT